jgi:hypothetical protein
MKIARLALLVMGLMTALALPDAFGGGKKGTVLPTKEAACIYTYTCTNGGSGCCNNTLQNCCDSCASSCGGSCGGLC